MYVHHPKHYNSQTTLVEHIILHLANKYEIEITLLQLDKKSLLLPRN